MKKTKAELFEELRERRKVRRMKRTNKVQFVDATLPRDQWTKQTRVTLMTKDNAAEEKIHNLLQGMRVHFHRERPIEVRGKKYFIDFLVTSIKADKREKIRVAVEVDGGYHFTPEQQDRDRKKDADLLASVRVNSILRISAKRAMELDRSQFTAMLLSNPVGTCTRAY
jgi:very-short-patch-repair endonuclease